MKRSEARGTVLHVSHESDERTCGQNKPSADCCCGNEGRECGSPEKDNQQSREKSLAITPKRRNHDLQKDQPTKVFGVIGVTGTKHREICARGTTTHYDEEHYYFGSAISHAGLLPTIALPRQPRPRKLVVSIDEPGPCFSCPSPHAIAHRWPVLPSPSQAAQCHVRESHGRSGGLPADLEHTPPHRWQ